MFHFLNFILLQLDSTSVAEVTMQQWTIQLAANYGSFIFSLFLLLIAYVLKIWMVANRALQNAKKLSVDIPIDISLLVMTAYASIDHSKEGVGLWYVPMILMFLLFLLVGMIIARCYFLVDTEKDAKEQKKGVQISLPIVCYVLMLLMVVLSIKL